MVICAGTWITAPAGYGKTTHLIDYQQSKGMRCLMLAPDHAVGVKGSILASVTYLLTHLRYAGGCRSHNLYTSITSGYWRDKSGPCQTVDTLAEKPALFNLWLPAIAPLTVLITGGLAYLSIVLFGLWLLSQQPWLGLNLQSSNEGKGLLVDAVYGAGPQDESLQGAIIMALGDANEHWVNVGSLSIMEEPDNLSTYAEYNHFFAHQAELYSLLSQAQAFASLDSGRSVALSMVRSRPIADLPFSYWIINFTAAVGLFFGLGIWVYRRGQASSRLLAIGGSGFMLLACTMAVYVSRELALPPQWFKALCAVNHLGAILFSYSALILLYYYPRRIGTLPFALIGFTVASLIWINETLQIVQWPIHAFYISAFIGPYFVGLILASQQWRLTRQRPLDRASLLWFLLTVFLSIGFAIVLYLGPTLFGEPPILPTWLAQSLLLTLYAGLALGALRYRLFDIERWWFASWIWFFGGVAVVASDLILVYLLNINPLSALSVAILITAWIYFPARQWLWERLVHSPERRLERYLPQLMESYFSATTYRAFKAQWPALLNKIFNPLSIRTVAACREEVRLSEYGLKIEIPSIQANSYVLLSGRDHGRRLFGTEEVKFTNALWTLTCKTADLRKLQEQAAQQERKRVMRDLHDDVGAKLLTLIHRAESVQNSELARSALKALREAIYSLDDQAMVSLESAMMQWHAEARQRLADADVSLDWQQPNQPPDIILTPRQRINLTRIIREAISNSLHHSQPEQITLSLKSEEKRLVLTIGNDGQTTDPSRWEQGAGMNNMRTRAKELGADIYWGQQAAEDSQVTPQTVVVVSMPTN